MAIELRQQIKLSQQLVMTPQLQQAIRLLQLSRLELMDTIRQELEENPALEEVQESVLEETSPDGPEESAPEAEAEKEVTIEETLQGAQDAIDWSNYLDEYNTPGKVHYEGEEREAPQYEAFVAQRESLSDHLFWQLLMTGPSEADQRIASVIIGNLNANGYLEVPATDVAAMSGETEEAVERVLALIQTFDPVGIGARNLSECLLIQAHYLETDTPIVRKIITGQLNHLENRNYKAIARALKVNVADVVTAVEVIRGLDPRPGRRFAEEHAQYITPDIYIYKIEDDFAIVLNDDGMPRLRVNAFYQSAVGRNGAFTKNAREYMQEKLRSASWLIKSIQQRQKTIYRVMESILNYQRDFFEKGIEHLRPMVLRDVADDIEMHESTISRVTTNKYAYTPQGIFELKYFFNSSIQRTNGDAMASASVQQRIRRLIDAENPKAPYSDDKIADLLKSANIQIARRTVAKYREMMKILPSHKRRQY